MMEHKFQDGWGDENEDQLFMWASQVVEERHNLNIASDTQNGGIEHMSSSTSPGASSNCESQLDALMTLLNSSTNIPVYKKEYATIFSNIRNEISSLRKSSYLAVGEAKNLRRKLEQYEDQKELTILEGINLKLSDSKFESEIKSLKSQLLFKNVDIHELKTRLDQVVEENSEYRYQIDQHTRSQADGRMFPNQNSFFSKMQEDSSEHNKGISSTSSRSKKQENINPRKSSLGKGRATEIRQQGSSETRQAVKQSHQRVRGKHGRKMNGEQFGEKEERTHIFAEIPQVSSLSPYKRNIERPPEPCQQIKRQKTQSRPTEPPRLINVTPNDHHPQVQYLPCGHCTSTKSRLKLSHQKECIHEIIPPATERKHDLLNFPVIVRRNFSRMSYFKFKKGPCLNAVQRIHFNPVPTTSKQSLENHSDALVSYQRFPNFEPRKNSWPNMVYPQRQEFYRSLLELMPFHSFFAEFKKFIPLLKEMRKLLLHEMIPPLCVDVENFRYNCNEYFQTLKLYAFEYLERACWRCQLFSIAPKCFLNKLKDKMFADFYFEWGSDFTFHGPPDDKIDQYLVKLVRRLSYITATFVGRHGYVWIYSINEAGIYLRVLCWGLHLWSRYDPRKYNDEKTKKLIYHWTYLLKLLYDNLFCHKGLNMEVKRMILKFLCCFARTGLCSKNFYGRLRLSSFFKDIMNDELHTIDDLTKIMELLQYCVQFDNVGSFLCPHTNNEEEDCLCRLLCRDFFKLFRQLKLQKDKIKHFKAFVDFLECLKDIELTVEEAIILKERAAEAFKKVAPGRAIEKYREETAQLLKGILAYYDSDASSISWLNPKLWEEKFRRKRQCQCRRLLWSYFIWMSHDVMICADLVLTKKKIEARKKRATRSKLLTLIPLLKQRKININERTVGPRIVKQMPTSKVAKQISTNWKNLSVENSGEILNKCRLGHEYLKKRQGNPDLSYLSECKPKEVPFDRSAALEHGEDMKHYSLLAHEALEKCIMLLAYAVDECNNVCSGIGNMGFNVLVSSLPLIEEYCKMLRLSTYVFSMLETALMDSLHGDYSDDDTDARFVGIMSLYYFPKLDIEDDDSQAWMNIGRKINREPPCIPYEDWKDSTNFFKDPCVRKNINVPFLNALESKYKKARVKLKRRKLKLTKLRNSFPRLKLSQAGKVERKKRKTVKGKKKVKKCKTIKRAGKQSKNK